MHPQPMLLSSLVLSAWLTTYQSCLSSEAGQSCQRFYAPILAACRNETLGCQARLENGRSGALNFARCFHPQSCVIENGFTARLFPGDERAEVRDPYESPYGESMEYDLEFSLPTEEPLDADNSSMVIAQFKANNDQSPVFALRWKGGRSIAITLRNPSGEVIVYRGELPTALSHRFTFQIRTGAEGKFAAKMDGQILAHYAGPLGYPGTFNYFKFGLYDYTRTQKSVVSLRYSSFSRRRPTVSL